MGIFIFLKKKLIINFRLSLKQVNKTLYKLNKKQKEKAKQRKLAVNIRILLNYMQIISILKFIKFEWPFYFKEYFNIFAYLSYASKILSFDCIFEDYDLKIERFYIQSTIFVFFPFIICFICGLVLMLFCSKDKIIKLHVCVYVVFTFFLPSAISQQLESIKCKEMDGKSYMVTNLNYQCFTNEHMQWVYI